MSKSSEMSFSMKFLEKEDWAEEKHCHICTRGFKKINRVFEHHWYKKISPLRIWPKNLLVVCVEEQFVENAVQRR